MATVTQPGEKTPRSKFVAESRNSSPTTPKSPETRPTTGEAAQERRAFLEAEPAVADVSGDLPLAGWQQQWVMGLAVGVPFLGTVLAIVWLWQYGWMGWLYLGLMVGGWMLTGLGITVGFHRLLTHRSFDTYPWMRAFWMSLGSLAIEGSPLVWCAIHRKHHQFSDQVGDPHSPHLHADGWWEQVKGFVHAHCGWMFTPFWSTREVEKYVPDLMQEPMLRAVDRVYYLWVLASFLIPAAIAGVVTRSWSGAMLGLVWGGFVRVFVTHHITWSINSICHVFGSRDYAAGDDSRNNLLFGILGHGEGWHNNHHAFPTSARHGLEWWQFDLSWLIIRGMQLCGLAWNVRLPSERSLTSSRRERP